MDPDQMQWIVVSDMGLHCLSLIHWLQTDSKMDLMLSMLGKNSADENLKYDSYFSQKIGQGWGWGGRGGGGGRCCFF